MHGNTIAILANIAVASSLLLAAWVQHIMPIFELSVVESQKVTRLSLFQIVFVYDILFISIYTISTTQVLRN